jgi:urease accessory protein
MDARTEVEVGLDDRGHTAVRRMQCEAPLLVRVIETGQRTLHLALVNGAAGPIGGDNLSFRLIVGPGARADVVSVAAQMAQPGPHGQPSTLHLDLQVASDAHLNWAPQPIVSVAGSDHRTMVHLSATSSSSVTMAESVSLGRHHEPPGRLALRQRVTIDDIAVLDHETVFAPDALSGPGAHGDGRTIVSTVNIVAEDAELPPARSAVSACGASATFHVSSQCALTIVTAG